MKENEYEYVLKLAIDKSNLDALVHLIIDNAELNYKGDDLRISNEEVVLQFIKYLYPNTYLTKLKELQKEDIKCQVSTI